MNTLPRLAIVFSSVALAGLIFVEMHDQADAQAGATSTPTPAVAQNFSSNAVPGVMLPDFSSLVEQAGPAVVNIEATIGGGNATAAADDSDGSPKDGSSKDQGDESQPPDQQDMPEFFRRFFGQPGAPGAPSPEARHGISFGSGFIISPDGYVLTNHHVIDGASEVIVHLTDRRELKARIVGSDESADVAVLKIDASNLPVLRLGDSHSLKPGQWVMAIGSPFGFDHSVTAGVVSGLGRPSIDGSQRYVPFIQTDVAINRGNSGGPLLNTRGEVVGINSQIFSNSGGYMGVSFAIPIEVAMNAVRQIEQSGHVTRGQLGVQIREVQRDEMAELGLSRPGGALVNNVQNGSAASKAGIRAGDVIVAFNGAEIARSSDLPPMVGAMAPGSRARVKLLRDGRPVEVTVVLELLNEQAAAAPTDGKNGKAPAASVGNALGIVVTEMDATTRAKLDLGVGEGVRVSRVVNPLAKQAGLSEGDVILQVGKLPVGSAAAFSAAAKSYKSGEKVRLLVRNADSTGLITVLVP